MIEKIHKLLLETFKMLSIFWEIFSVYLSLFFTLQALKKFIENVNGSPEASSILLNWNLKLAPECIQLEGRQLNAEKLLLGKNVTVTVNAKADWGRESTNNTMLQAVDLKKWVVMYVDKNADVAKSFQNLMTKVN